MSGRAPQKPPKDALKIRVESREEEQQVAEWLTVGIGFPFYIPEDADLYISRDGRTLYGEKFLVRIGRESYHSPIRRWDYQVDHSGTELTRRPFAYPITRPLSRYAPTLAERLHLP